MKGLQLFSVLLACSMSSCTQPSSPEEPDLDASINDKTVYFRQSERFTLKLDLSADAGYEWEYSISDTHAVRIDSISFAPKSGNWNQVGGTTVETFFFCAAHMGRSVIDLQERRRWEQSVPAIRVIRFTVLVIR